MSRLDTMTDEQFERHALEGLGRELGADALARFLRLNRSGGRLHSRRKSWQKNLTIEEIFDSILSPRRRATQCPAAGCVSRRAAVEPFVDLRIEERRGNSAGGIQNPATESLDARDLLARIPLGRGRTSVPTQTGRE
jgi:hypothetical protein